MVDIFLQELPNHPTLIVFFCHQAMHFRQMFGQYATMQVPTLHFHFDPTFIQSLSFRAKLGGQGVVGG
jgi:hypothetical protein